ncbi:hypothetical protein R2325_03290 [Mycobacteroides chelonae]|uniref:hypothetical protein n=1 Tax=Mycobacteroides chelonae TaxID=1774 RepID=UPI0010564763|nr:hypothetical protein [Mycobacteroides chelonae]MEC4845691.1 hypothetical protein [Mycobacteroides chelonae]MEC4854781.1 hypothetical protein [Mycobacteroides chelonae]MEC4869358.1 hypothetical protein [Mycobacteroides chelonae]WED90668.1 hypothetical protein PXJ67_17865 [Mycobacteroides chelonae]WED97111.1 hypothetical protein PYW02_00590 [Mycobacteroides chelonae]
MVDARDDDPGNELGDPSQASSTSADRAVVEPVKAEAAKDSGDDEGLVLSEHELAQDRVVETEILAEVHQRRFRWVALVAIAGLCVFFAVATLTASLLASTDAQVQVASDIAKTAIPTLLTLLGTAVAWAFKGERD